MKTVIAKACSSLGVHVNGAEKGPKELDIDNLVDKVLIEEADIKNKELERDNKRKNFKEVNNFNKSLYNKIVKEKDFVIAIGGDHSIAIGSDLASIKKYPGEGLLWIDAHSDYHTLDSTISGNIHGMPFATISGQNGNELSKFFDGEYFDPKKTVLIGGRDIEAPEYEIIKNAGVKIFTTEDIKKLGVKKVMEESITIAGNNMHISYDLDVIDPLIAPGVSVKAVNGINEKEAYEILDILLDNINKINSFDLVEFNPDNDKDDVTKNIALNILNKLINKVKEKN